MAIVVVLDWTLQNDSRANPRQPFRAPSISGSRSRSSSTCCTFNWTRNHASLGTLAAQVGSLEAVRQFFSATVVFALVDLPFALMFLAFIGVIGGAVAWVYALLLPVALLLGFVTQWRLRGLLRNQLSRSNERQGLLVDSIRGAESIRANNAGWRFAGEWQEITASIDRYAIQQRAISSSFHGHHQQSLDHRVRSLRWWSVSGRSRRAC